MPFKDSIKNAAFKQSGGRCECRRARHDWHAGKQRCKMELTRHSAQFHHRTSQAASGSDGLTKCEFLCRKCHEGTVSYGRH